MRDTRKALSMRNGRYKMEHTSPNKCRYSDKFKE